ncbi:helix-turn-helix domain-containing protein [Alicyclobacillus fastidiosus]|uniref:Helix-turn-helix domain-containing protein n=1 Tax=Alicyclobacillus fastidiosus TaxID=392011 RepID=A0ABV5ABE5_9BACL|nr:helix-turn-helix domain-containing protein [Alicyclobacillus fastidiosus]WEH10450.1 helix-turn-helix domain-containing protein [Alicyclobacillus fastidiosus]
MTSKRDETFITELQNRLSQTELLVECAEYFTSSLKFEEVMTRILQRTLEVIPAADAGVLFIHDKDSNTLKASACSGFDWEYMQHIALSPGESMSGLTFEKEVAQIFDNPNRVIFGTMSEGNQKFYTQSLNQMKQIIGPKFIVRGVICAPLIIKGDCIGVMTLDNFTGDSFTSDDLRLVVAISNQAAIAVENAGLYREETSRSHRFQQLSQVIQRQNDELTRINQAHERLMKQVLNGGSTEDIGSLVFSILGNPVIVYDEWLTVLTQHVPPTLDFPLQSPTLMSEMQFVLQSEQIRHVSLQEPGGSFFAVSLFPIVTAHEILGVLCVVESNHPLDEQDVVLAEQCNLVLALDFMKRESIFEAEQRVKGGFLDELITEDNVGVLKQRARLIGLTDGDTYSFMVVDVGGIGKADSRTYRHIHRKVEQLALNSNRSSLVITKLNTIVILNAMPKGLGGDLVLARSRKLGESFIEALRASYPTIDCAIGIGRICDEIGDLFQSYQDAKQCVALIQRQQTSNVVRDYVEMGAMRFILNQPKDQLLEFVKMTLKPLLSCAPSKRMELLKTLDAFIRSGRQHKEAAATLGIHPNTFAYRLKRLEDILGYPLQSSTNFDLHFAWKVVDTFHLNDELYGGNL